MTREKDSNRVTQTPQSNTFGKSLTRGNEPLSARLASSHSMKSLASMTTNGDRMAKTPRSVFDEAKIRTRSTITGVPKERTPQELYKREYLWKINMSLCWEKTIDRNLRRDRVLDSGEGVNVDLERGTLNKGKSKNRNVQEYFKSMAGEITQLCNTIKFFEDTN